MQAFEGGLFQQDQGVANIVPIGVRMSRQYLFDAGHQTNRPASGLRGAYCWMALSHVDGGRLTSHGRIVTAVPYSTLAFAFTSASRLWHDPEQAFQQVSLPW